MNHPKRHVDPPNRGRSMYDEADIGSGERTPGEHETEEMIRSINPPRPAADKDGKSEPAPPAPAKPRP